MCLAIAVVCWPVTIARVNVDSCLFWYFLSMLTSFYFVALDFSGFVQLNLKNRRHRIAG
jgi:hypothetical protein